MNCVVECIHSSEEGCYELCGGVHSYEEGCYELCDEISPSITCGKFLENSRNYDLLKRTVLRSVSV